MQDVLDVETLVGNTQSLQFSRASTAHKSIARRLHKALGELSSSSSTDNLEGEEEYLSFEEWSTTESEGESEAEEENSYISIEGGGSEENRDELCAEAASATTTAPPVALDARSLAAGWSVGEVVQWLNVNDLNDFVERFEYHRFGGEQLLLLDWTSIKLLGQRTVARRRKLLDKIAVLARNVSAANLPRSARKTMTANRHKRRFTTARKIRRGVTTKGTPLRKSASAAAAAAMVAAASFPGPSPLPPTTAINPTILQPPIANAESSKERRRRALPTPPPSPSKEGNRVGLKADTEAQPSQSAANDTVLPEKDPVLVHTYVNLQSLGLNTAGEPVLEQPAAPTGVEASSEPGSDAQNSTAHTYVNLQSMGLNTAGEPLPEQPAVATPAAGSGVHYTEVEPASKHQDSSAYGTVIAPDDDAVHTYVNLQAEGLNTAGKSVLVQVASSGVHYTEVEHVSKQHESSSYGTAIAPDDGVDVDEEPLYDTRTLPESKVTPIKHHHHHHPQQTAALPHLPEGADTLSVNPARPRAATVGFDYANPRTLNLARKQKDEAEAHVQQNRARPRAATAGFDYADPRKVAKEAVQHPMNHTQTSASERKRQQKRPPLQNQQQHRKGRQEAPSKQQPGDDRRKGMPRAAEVAPPVPERPSRTENSSGDLDLSIFPWYRGLLSRQDAEQLLASAKQGSFLMRSSSRAPEPVVSFVHGGTIQHCRVRKNDAGLYKLGEIKDGGYHQSLRGMFKHFASSLLQHAV